MIRNIVWDVDGTLFDTYPAITRSFLAALDELGYVAEATMVYDLAKISMGHCAATLAARFQVCEADLLEKFIAHYDLVGPEEQPPFHGVCQICEYICSINGKNVIVTHRGTAGTNELLEANQMRRLFSGCVTRDDGHAKKPDPSAFHAIIQAQGLPVDETINIGDREIDIMAGQAAGLFSCYFGSGTSAAELIFQDYADLFSYILQSNQRAL